MKRTARNQQTRDTGAPASALLPVQIAAGWTERTISIELARVEPAQRAKHSSEKSIERLARNIFVKGLLQNLAVTDASYLWTRASAGDIR